jgi:hypothetical protein
LTERADKVGPALAEYFRYFDKNRIFLPSALCDSLESYARHARGPALLYGIHLGIQNPTPQTRQDTEEARQEFTKFVQEEVPKMRAAIEAEFRQLLGHR